VGASAEKEKEEALSKLDALIDFLEVEEEEESARGGISGEDYINSGPWLSKGNPTGFLGSEDEEIMDQWGHN